MYTDDIHHVLNKLGLGRRFLGYSIAFDAVAMLLRDDMLIHSCRRCILEPIARQHHCRPENIERNLRTAISHAWQTNPDYLRTIAAYPLTKAPSTKEFLDILSTAILRDRISTH